MWEICFAKIIVEVKFAFFDSFVFWFFFNLLKGGSFVVISAVAIN